MRNWTLIAACAAGCGQAGKGGDPVDGVFTDGGPSSSTTSVETGTSTPPAPTTDACGGCPEGSTCGTANGIAVCRDTVSGIPRFEHVFLIMMENTSGSTLIDSANTPYLHSLLAEGAYATNYHGVEHPSLPNYLALMSGQIETNGPTDCDCQPTGGACGPLSCNTLLNNCGCPQSHDQLVDQLEAVGVTWRAYAESMGTPCNLVESGDYAPKHVPFLYFPSLTDDATRCDDHVVEYTSNFAADLATGARKFSYVAPNLTDDMHDPIVSTPQNLANGDAWAAAEIPQILDSSAWSDRGILLVVWDEDDYSGLFDADAPIPMILLSPLANQGEFTSNVHYDHLDLLATLEDAFGVPRLGQAAQGTPLSDFFPPN